jgi:hypothetical protein
MGPMTLTRIATYAGAVLLTVFVAIVLAYGAYGAGNGVIVVVALVLLIVAGSRLYGRRSHYAAAAARNRSAQEVHDRAADLAADARQAAATAAKRGERYCPLDPANHVSANGQAAATNGHAPAVQPAPPPAPPHPA